MFISGREIDQSVFVFLRCPFNLSCSIFLSVVILDLVCFLFNYNYIMYNAFDISGGMIICLCEGCGSCHGLLYSLEQVNEQDPRIQNFCLLKRVFNVRVYGGEII